MRFVLLFGLILFGANVAAAELPVGTWVDLKGVGACVTDTLAREVISTLQPLSRDKVAIYQKTHVENCSFIYEQSPFSGQIDNAKYISFGDGTDVWLSSVWLDQEPLYIISLQPLEESHTCHPQRFDFFVLQRCP